MAANDADSTGADTNDGRGEETGGAEKTFTRKELNSYLANQKREIESRFADFDQIRSKAEEFDRLQESTKSESQKLTDQLNDYRTQLEEAKYELEWRDTVLRRNEIAASKGLSPKLWARIKGETDDEINADVDELLTFSVSRPRTAGLSGAAPSDPGTAKERAAAALRTIRER